MKSIFLHRLIIGVSILLVTLFLGFFPGCMFYYKVKTVNKVTAQEIKKYDSLNKYLILHQGDSAWHIEKSGISDNKLSGELAFLPGQHLLYKSTDPKGGNRYLNTRRHDESCVLDEVHLYLYDSLVPRLHAGDSIRLALPAIKKAEVYKKAKGRTTASWVVPAVGVPILVIGGIAAIAVASGSCPFIYLSDGDSYSFIGEIYGGAIYPSMERDDYLLLPGFKAVDNQFKLKIVNNLKEHQFTNLADLLVISHPENSSVYLDKYGCVQTTTDEQVPLSATSLNNNDCLDLVKENDNDFFRFNDYNSKTSVNQVILTFENKNGADTGKLIVNAMNSLWADYAFEKFNELFGSYYSRWDEKQKQVPREKQIKRSLDQDIPLSVYLETNQGWEFVDYFPVVGAAAARDMVMAIDLTKVKSKNVRIKLVTGFMFWEIGLAVMDFTDNVPVQTMLIKPSDAIDEKGHDVLPNLYNDDDLRLEQLTIGNEAVVTYDVPQYTFPADINKKKTICLHSKGYYEKIADYKGKTNWAHLMTLKHPHSFSDFSLKEYEKICKNSGSITMKR
jgi:hypothetical protein